MSRPLLSPAQTRVVTRLAHGDTYQQAAARLCISPGTVKNHRDDAAQRLGARNTTHLVALALAHRLVTLAPTLTPRERTS
ncbi:response regulator transcription factor [Streptomyces sp. NPDC020983]|uniref:response regulator transcription factor n=1 Tax=Streptomyces sp. NPDC020983 TaxID=3365106 RepID=UPI0037BA31C2